MAFLSSLVVLTGCATTPEPDPTLTSLADKASPAQATALAEEASRLCGTKDNAALCTISPAASGTLTSDEVLAAVDGVPESSLPVLAKTYVAMAMNEPAKDFGSSTAFSDMREFEQAAVYGLDHMLAFAGASTSTVKATQKSHEAVLGAMGSSATPAPMAYDLQKYPAEPADFVFALEADAALRWMNAACAPGIPAADRTFALIQAGNAAARYAELGGQPGDLGL